MAETTGARVFRRGLLRVAEVAGKILEGVPVDLATADRLLQQGKGRVAFRNHLLLLDDWQRRADFPFRLTILTGPEQDIGEYEVKSGDVPTHPDLTGFPQRRPIGF